MALCAAVTALLGTPVFSLLPAAALAVRSASTQGERETPGICGVARVGGGGGLSEPVGQESGCGAGSQLCRWADSEGRGRSVFELSLSLSVMALPLLPVSLHVCPSLRLSLVQSLSSLPQLLLVSPGLSCLHGSLCVPSQCRRAQVSKSCLAHRWPVKAGGVLRADELSGHQSGQAWEWQGCGCV